MLTYTEYPADCSKPTYGEEHHGNEVVKNVSVYLTTSVGADALEAIKPGLRDALFVRPAINDSARIGEDGEVHELVRRFTSMDAIKFDDDYPGCALTLHKSELFDEDAEWADVEIGKFSVEPKDGGTAIVRFRAQMRHDLAPWVEMYGRTVRITLTPPPDKPLPAEHADAPGDDPTSDIFANTDIPALTDVDAPEGADLNRLDEASRNAEEVAQMKQERIDESFREKAKGRRARKANGAAATAH